MEFVNIKNIIAQAPNAHIFMLVGRRGCGKSYSPEMYCIEEAIMNNRQFCMVGRYKEDVKPGEITKAFTHITSYNSNTGTVPIMDIMRQCDIYNFPAYDIEAKTGNIYLVGVDGELRVKLKTIGCYTSVQTAERFKRGSYPDTYNIFFDEFITKRRYIFGRNEPNEFKKIVNTIARGSKDYKVFMAGNPDNEIEMNPYIESFNLIYDDIEPGSMITYDNGSTVFVKLAGDDEFEYINRSTETLFGMSDTSSHTGEVDRPEAPKITEEMLQGFDPIYSIRTETATIAVDAIYPYRRCFYIFVGIYDNTPVTLVTHHRAYNSGLQFTSKYDRLEMLPDMFTFHRFDFPASLQQVKNMLYDNLRTGRTYFESDRVANILLNLMEG